MWSRAQDLHLSAEQSYDPNMDPDHQSLLLYSWECQSTSQVRLYSPSLSFLCQMPFLMPLRWFMRCRGRG